MTTSFSQYPSWPSSESASGQCLSSYYTQNTAGWYIFPLSGLAEGILTMRIDLSCRRDASTLALSVDHQEL